MPSLMATSAAFSSRKIPSDNAPHFRGGADKCVIRNKKHPRTGQDAFSLLEILIGLTLIAILTSLIFVGAQKFQQNAHTVKCLGQLRTLWYGAMQFVQDHDGKFPSLNIEKSSNDDKSPGFREYLGYTKNLLEETLYSCPEAHRGDGGKYAGGGNMCRSYSVNQRMVYNWADKDSGATIVSDPISRYSNARSLHECLYLVDGVPNTDSPTPPKAGKGIQYYSNVSHTTAPKLRELHGGKLNAIYLDGHAASLKKADLQLPKDDIIWGGAR